MKSLKQAHVLAPLIIVLCSLIYPISLNAEKTKEDKVSEPSLEQKLTQLREEEKAIEKEIEALQQSQNQKPEADALSGFSEEGRKKFLEAERTSKQLAVGFRQQQRLEQQAQQQEEGEESGLLRSAGDPQMNGSQNITVGAERTGMHVSDILQVLLLVAMAVFLICAIAKGRSQKNKSRENTSDTYNQVNIYQSVFFFLGVLFFVVQLLTPSSKRIYLNDVLQFPLVYVENELWGLSTETYQVKFIDGSWRYHKSGKWVTLPQTSGVVYGVEYPPTFD